MYTTRTLCISTTALVYGEYNAMLSK